MRLNISVIAFFCLIILAGCTIKEAAKNGLEEDRLRERVMVYWAHKCKGEFDKTYDFEYPLYKKTTTMVEYIKGSSVVVTWKAARIKDINISGELANVTLMVDTMNKLPLSPGAGGKGFLAKDVEIKEKWMNVENVWYHVPGNN